MRRAIAALTFAVILASALGAQTGEYYGTIVRRPDLAAGDSGFSGHLTLRLTVGERGLARVTFGRGPWWSDSGWAARWGDTLYAVTHDEFGDTTLWLGSRRGGGYAGERYSYSFPGTGRKSGFSFGLTGGDSLVPIAPPPAAVRDSLYAFIGRMDRTIAKHRARAVAEQPKPSSVSVADVIGWIFGLIMYSPFLIGIFIYLHALVKKIGTEARRLVDRARVRGRAMARAFRRDPARRDRPRYAVPCPLCRSGFMEVAHALYVVRGRGIFPTIERRIVAGCAPCVEREGKKTALHTLATGIWSVGGMLGAPAAALYDLAVLRNSRDRTLVERLLRDAGVEPLMVRMDDDDLVPRERARLNLHLFVCSRIVWAEGERAPKAHAEALRFLGAIVEGKIQPRRLEELLVAARWRTLADRILAPEERAVICGELKRLVLAHEHFTMPMDAALHEIARVVGLTPNELEQLRRDITDALWVMDAPARERREREKKEQERQERERQERERWRRASDAGARQGGHQQSGHQQGGHQQGGHQQGGHQQGGHQRSGHQQSGNHQGHQRRPRYSPDDLRLARAVLGVSENATAADIERAYRSCISIWHPDRAGLDPLKAKECNIRSQQINWAVDALRRAVMQEAS